MQQTSSLCTTFRTSSLEQRRIAPFLDLVNAHKKIDNELDDDNFFINAGFSPWNSVLDTSKLKSMITVGVRDVI